MDDTTLQNVYLWAAAIAIAAVSFRLTPIYHQVQLWDLAWAVVATAAFTTSVTAFLLEKWDNEQQLPKLLLPGVTVALCFLPVYLYHELSWGIYAYYAAWVPVLMTGWGWLWAIKPDTFSVSKALGVFWIWSHIVAVLLWGERLLLPIIILNWTSAALVLYHEIISGTLDETDRYDWAQITTLRVVLIGVTIPILLFWPAFISLLSLLAIVTCCYMIENNRYSPPRWPRWNFAFWGLSLTGVFYAQGEPIFWSIGLILSVSILPSAAMQHISSAEAPVYVKNKLKMPVY